MPALLPVVGVAEVQLFMLYRGRVCSVRTFWQDSAGLEYALADVQTLSTAVAGAWATNIGARLSDDVTGDSFVGTDLSSDTAPRYEDTWTWTGGQAVEGLPLNVAMCLKFLQLRRYRGGKSHIFIPGFPINVTTDEAHWTSAIASAVRGDWSIISTAAQTLTTSHGQHWEQCVVSRFAGKVERVPPLSFPISDAEVQLRICTRRKRLPKITA